MSSEIIEAIAVSTGLAVIGMVILAWYLASKTKW